MLDNERLGKSEAETMYPVRQRRAFPNSRLSCHNDRRRVSISLNMPLKRFQYRPIFYVGTTGALGKRGMVPTLGVERGSKPTFPFGSVFSIRNSIFHVYFQENKQTREGSEVGR
ncbi:MAG: hypothetical protein JWQ98_2243 [Chlorobi bacterium]|nr:hypothetical protein [Chlorobiota bacterium]